jgi:hypothetical protein
LKNTKIAALVAGALVAGLVLGGIGIASAGPTATTGSAVSSAASGMRGGARGIVVALAKLTGLSTTQIVAERATGVSFATIATENGVDPSAVVDAVVAGRRAQLDALVASGAMTQAHEDALLAALGARVLAMVEMTPGSGTGSTTTTPSVNATRTMSPHGHHAAMGQHRGFRMGVQARAAAHARTHMTAPAGSAIASSAPAASHRSARGSAMGGSGSHMGSFSGGMH